MPERHEITVEDGERVVAVHHERQGRPDVSPAEREGLTDVNPPEPGNRSAAASSADCVAFCHGFLSDKSGSYEERCEHFAAAGYDAVRFDFRGSGESDRAFVDATLRSRIADLRAVLAFFDPGPVALFGSSFGAKVALHSTDDDRVAALVGRAPVTYDRAFEAYREAVEEAGTLRIDDDHAIDGRFFDDLERYDFADVADRIDVPVAFFHGTDDGSVPLADSLEAVAALETDVLLQTYRGEGHRFSRDAEARLRRRTLDWLATV